MNVQPVYNVLDPLLQKKLFRIPTFQRAYSWEKRQRQDLFEDIGKLLADSAAKLDRHHFMATVVCLKRDEIKSIGTPELSQIPGRLKRPEVPSFAGFG
jgi:hypothetical protein